MNRERLAIPARLIGFVISPVAARVAPTGTVTPKSSKAAPNYAGILPLQQIVERTPITLGGLPAVQIVKTYDPGFAIAEITVEVDDLLTAPLFDIHTELIETCRARSFVVWTAIRNFKKSTGCIAFPIIRATPRCS